MKITYICPYCSHHNEELLSGDYLSSIIYKEDASGLFSINELKFQCKKCQTYCSVKFRISLSVDKEIKTSVY